MTVQYSFVCNLMPPRAVLQIVSEGSQKTNDLVLASTTSPEVQSVSFVQMNKDDKAILIIGDSKDNFLTVDPNCAFEIENIVAYPNLVALTSYSKMVSKDFTAVESAVGKIQSSATSAVLHDNISDAISLFEKVISDISDQIDLLELATPNFLEMQSALESRKFHLATSRTKLLSTQLKLQPSCNVNDVDGGRCDPLMKEMTAELKEIKTLSFQRIEGVRNFLNSELIRIGSSNSKLAESITKILKNIEDKK